MIAVIIAIQTLPVSAANPSIMVVPYKTSATTYSDVLESSADIRMAVDKVNEGLKGIGIDPIDLSAAITQTLKAQEYEDGVTVDSRDKQLLDQSGCDVYITVDMEKRSSYNGNSVSMTLKAHNRATGKILVTKVGASPTFRSNAYEKMCIVAVDQIFKSGFLDKVNEEFAKTASEGTSIMLRIALGDNMNSDSESAVFDLMQHMTSEGRFPNVVRNWLRANCVDPDNIHSKGSNAELIIYDNVQMPPVTADGYKMYADEYAGNFVNYLYSIGIIAQERIDGETIYITIY